MGSTLRGKGYKILKNQRIAEGIYQAFIEAPLIAERARPGQFLILRVDEKGERIPLTIHDVFPEEGKISIIYQVVGKTTAKLSSLSEENKILDVVGPLGKEFSIHGGRLLFVAGGVGAAPIYPKVKEAKDNAEHITLILGARKKELLILLEDFFYLCHKVLLCTDDGSVGKKGFVTDILEPLLEEERFDACICVGPLLMMEKVCQITKGRLPTYVSLNTIMVDGTGMCGSCQVFVDGEIRFACCDGPTFDGHKVDFHQLILRQSRFKKQEEEALRVYEKSACKGKESCGKNKGL